MLELSETQIESYADKFGTSLAEAEYELQIVHAMQYLKVAQDRLDTIIKDQGGTTLSVILGAQQAVLGCLIQAQGPIKIIPKK